MGDSQRNVIEDMCRFATLVSTVPVGVLAPQASAGTGETVTGN